MSKFYGKIGYANMVETAPGVWEEEIVESPYYGEWIRNTRRLQSADQLNDNINIANKLSIVKDAYADDHFHAMRYVEFAGAKWKVTDVEPLHPRLILTLGGLYNEQSPRVADEV